MEIVQSRLCWGRKLWRLREGRIGREGQDEEINVERALLKQHYFSSTHVEIFTESRELNFKL
jgi:hypothetical protein